MINPLWTFIIIVYLLGPPCRNIMCWKRIFTMRIVTCQCTPDSSHDLTLRKSSQSFLILTCNRSRCVKLSLWALNIMLHSSWISLSWGIQRTFMWMIWDLGGTMGYNAVYKLWVSVESGGFMVSHGKEKPSTTIHGTLYHVTKKYFVHKTSRDLKKTVAFLSGIVCI